SLAFRHVAEEPRGGADGERGRGAGQVRAARRVRHDGELRVGDERELERERARWAAAIGGEDRDGRAERARGDRDRARPCAEEAAQPRLGPARGASRVELDRDALELAAAVPELRDAAGDVEREADLREPHDELDDVEALE